MRSKSVLRACGGLYERREVGVRPAQYHRPVAWYEEWFGEEYLELYAHRDFNEAERDIDFVERVLGPRRPSAVLDLACGAGRHTATLLRRGYRTLGVDLSLTLLARAEKLPSVAADMRRLPFQPATFGWILNFFTSFGYFERERENFEVLQEFNRLLQPGGRFLIDLFNRERVLQDLVKSETVERGGRTAIVERWFDQSTQRVNKRIRLLRPERQAREFVESVRAYSREEVAAALQWAGLEVDSIFGNFDGSEFGCDSERLIFIGHKPNE